VACVKSGGNENGGAEKSWTPRKEYVDEFIHFNKYSYSAFLVQCLILIGFDNKSEMTD